MAGLLGYMAAGALGGLGDGLVERVKQRREDKLQELRQRQLEDTRAHQMAMQEDQQQFRAQEKALDRNLTERRLDASEARRREQQVYDRNKDIIRLANDRYERMMEDYNNALRDTPPTMDEARAAVAAEMPGTSRAQTSARASGGGLGAGMDSGLAPERRDTQAAPTPAPTAGAMPAGEARAGDAALGTKERPHKVGSLDDLARVKVGDWFLAPNGDVRQKTKEVEMPSDARPSSAAPEQPQPPGAQIGDVMGGLANETRPVVPGARGGMREAPSEPPWQTEGNTEPKGLAARARSLHGERSVPVLTEAQAADAPPGTTYRLPNDPPGTVRTVPGPRRR